MNIPYRQGKIDVTLPPDWRKGQAIVNFIGWIARKHPGTTVYYMEDPEFDQLWKLFIQEHDPAR